MPELIDAPALREALERTGDRLVTSPGWARARPRVTARLERDVRAVVRFEQHGRPFELRCDDAPVRGGTGTAPSPMRYLLSSIAFSLEVWTARTAALQGLPVEGLEVEVRGMIDMRGEHLVDGIPPHPQWFVLDVRAESPAGGDAVVELVRTGVRRCPVTSLVAAAVPVHLMVTHNGSTLLDERPTELAAEHEEVR